MFCEVQDCFFGLPLLFGAGELWLPAKKGAKRLSAEEEHWEEGVLGVAAASSLSSSVSTSVGSLSGRWTISGITEASAVELLCIPLFDSIL